MTEIKDIKFSKYESRVPQAFDHPIVKTLTNYVGSTKDVNPVVPYIDYIITGENTDSMKSVSFSVFSKRFDHPTVSTTDDLTRYVVNHILKKISEHGQETFKDFLKDVEGWSPRLDGIQKVSREVTFKENWFQWILNKFRRSDNRFIITEEIDPTKEYDLDTRRNMMARKLVTKILAGSNYIYHKGRIGAANTLIVNGKIGSILCDVGGYTIKSTDAVLKAETPLPYIAGTLYGLTVIVDPYRRWDDHRITLLRVGEKDQPGFFLSYLRGSLSKKAIAEGTTRPKKKKECRLSIVELGQDVKNQYLEFEVDIPDDFI